MTSIQLSQEKSLQVYNLDNALSLKILSVEKAVNSETPSLTKMIKATNEKKVSYLIMGLLVNMNNKLKFKEKLTENEIRGLSESIMDKYYYLKLSDFVYVFNQISDGEIDLFGSLSHRDVMKALKDHTNLRWKYKNHGNTIHRNTNR